MNGIIVIDKPKGYTSFDIVSKLRRLCGQKKAGHTGTLDPMATGVLPILLGEATKTQMFMDESDKEYEAQIQFGVTTDTQDITGTILSKNSADIKYDDLKREIKKFIGTIEQIPPMYSAIKKNGKKLYELAREGKIISREPRKVTIHSIDVLNFNAECNSSVIKVQCSKGTYIRTLCHDIGDGLGCGAVMSELRRIKSNSFSLEDSITLEKATELSANGNLSDSLISMDCIFKNLSPIIITNKQYIRIKNGGALDLNRVDFKGRPFNGMKVRIFFDNRMIGLGIINDDNQEVRPLRIFGFGE